MLTICVDAKKHVQRPFSMGHSSPAQYFGKFLTFVRSISKLPGHLGIKCLFTIRVSGKATQQAVLHKGLLTDTIQQAHKKCNRYVNIRTVTKYCIIIKLFIVKLQMIRGK
jgi:hypothetical protein